MREEPATAGAEKLASNTAFQSRAAFCLDDDASEDLLLSKDLLLSEDLVSDDDIDLTDEDASKMDFQLRPSLDALVSDKDVDLDESDFDDVEDFDSDGFDDVEDLDSDDVDNADDEFDFDHADNGSAGFDSYGDVLEGMTESNTDFQSRPPLDVGFAVSRALADEPDNHDDETATTLLFTPPLPPLPRSRPGGMGRRPGVLNSTAAVTWVDTAFQRPRPISSRASSTSAGLLMPGTYRVGKGPGSAALRWSTSRRQRASTSALGGCWAGAPTPREVVSMSHRERGCEGGSAPR